MAERLGETMRRSGGRRACTFESSAGTVCGKIRSAYDDFEKKKEKRAGYHDVCV